MEYIKVGVIVNTFGLRGELKVESLTDFPEIRFKVGQELFIHYQNKYVSVIVHSMRQHKNFYLVSFEGLQDINLVEQYKGCVLYIHRTAVHVLPVGEYYYFELNGCDVYDRNAFIGKVEKVESGYQTILRIKSGDKEILVPYVDAFIHNVDVANKRIDVELIEGFL